MAVLDPTSPFDRSLAREARVESDRAIALSTLFDSTSGDTGSGTPLPPLWHWAALSRWPAAARQRSDGHPHDEELTGPPGFPRRMFGGGELRLFGDIVSGQKVFVTRSVSSFVRKEGRSGAFYAADVVVRIADESNDVLVEERQNILFRPEAAPSPDERPAPPPRALVGSPLERSDEGIWHFRTDPSLLVRFSAATSNAHRIHYDWPYATRSEGYPDLVVHGPFIVLAALEVFRVQHPDRHVAAVSHRGRRPLFVGTDAQITASASAPVDSLEEGPGITELTVMGADHDNITTPFSSVTVTHTPMPKEVHHA